MNADPFTTTVANHDIFSVRGLWKLFGPHAHSYHGGAKPIPSREELRRLGLFAAVQDVNFSVREGETFVIMGLSGSGKSTLLRCLCGLLLATAGSVNLQGADLTTIAPAALREIRRHKIGMVFQDYALLPNRNVLENVMLPLEVQGMKRAQREQRAHELIEMVGLSERISARPGELSGGQQQRVGIARSLAIDPQIWLLDEPFSALDPLIRKELQDELLRLQCIMRKTIIFITHDFDEAVKLATRVAIMRDGQIVQIGAPEELVLSPACEYVANFTHDVDRSRVITLRSIMEPLSGKNLPEGPGIRSTLCIGAVAREIISMNQPKLVIDEQAQPVGLVTPHGLLQALFTNQTVL